MRDVNRTEHLKSFKKFTLKFAKTFVNSSKEIGKKRKQQQCFVILFKLFCGYYCRCFVCLIFLFVQKTENKQKQNDAVYRDFT